jgi:hypothetical protein
MTPQKFILLDINDGEIRETHSVQDTQHPDTVLLTETEAVYLKKASKAKRMAWANRRMKQLVQHNDAQKDDD